jgi:tRNA 2-thiouridine synthesizing protein A
LPTEGHLIDARGLKCPLPVLKLEKLAESLAKGDELNLLATDPMAEIDVALYCRQRGHACEMTREDDVLRFAIVIGG